MDQETIQNGGRMEHRTHRQRIGQRGEDLAVETVERAGITVLERNWRGGRVGELDLIGVDELGEIVIVEVKTRTSEAFGGSLEAVDHRKLARMRRLAALWLRSAGRRFLGADVRFDVIGVQLDEHSGETTIDWIKAVVP